MTITRLTDSTLTVVSVSYGAGILLAQLGGPFGWPLMALLMLSLWRYGYAVLRAVALDRRHLPAPDVETMHPIGEGRLVAHFMLFAGLFILLGLYSGTATPASTAAWWLALLALAAIFPASCAIMGISGSLSAAVHPLHLATLAGTMGLSYLRLLATCAVLLATATGLIVLTRDLGWVAQLFSACLFVWMWLAVFALTGDAVGDYRAELDLHSDREHCNEEDERRWHREHMNVLDRAYASLRSGLVNEGYRTLKTMLTEEGEDPALYQWLLNRMFEWEDHRHVCAVAARFVARLVELGRIQDALELAEQFRRRSPDFTLDDDTAVILARYAREIGHHWLADELTADLNRGRPPPDVAPGM